MPNRDRLPLILWALMNDSDDEKWMTTADLRRMLEAEGYEWSIRSLRKDIRSLQNSGFEIAVRESEGASTQYAWMGRELSATELQLLIDAVSSAQFIPGDQSRKLTKKLSRMAGPSHTEELRPRILASETGKSKGKSINHSVQAIRKAIDRDQRISFRYPQGSQAEDYVVSPYAAVLKDGRFYLVGWSDREKRISAFRIDRMQATKQVQRKRVRPPENFDIRDYTDRAFLVSDGPEVKVTLHCCAEALDEVMDCFGEVVQPENRTDESFEVTVPVKMGAAFYGWMVQNAGKIRIQGPEQAKKAYAEYLEQALNDVPGVNCSVIYRKPKEF